MSTPSAGQLSLGQIRQMEAPADRSHVLHRLFPPRLVFRPGGKLPAELSEIRIGDAGAVGAEWLAGRLPGDALDADALLGIAGSGVVLPGQNEASPLALLRSIGDDGVAVAQRKRVWPDKVNPCGAAFGIEHVRLLDRRLEEVLVVFEVGQDRSHLLRADGQLRG